MSALNFPYTYIGGTVILASEANANNAAIATWSNGNIDDSNFGTFTGSLDWTVASNVLCLSGTSSSNLGVMSFSQTGALDAARSVLNLTSPVAQTAGDALANFSFTNASSSIPVLRLTNAGTGNFITARTAAGVDKFTVASSGNTAISGTLAVTGASTLTGNVAMAGTLTIGAGPVLSNSGGALAVAGRITKGSLPLVGEQTSASSGSFITSSIAVTDITNLSVTITTTGRPVSLTAKGVPGSVAHFISQLTVSSTSTRCFLSWDRSGTSLGETQFGGVFSSSSANNSIETVPGIVNMIDDNNGAGLAAGTYTYKLRVRANTNAQFVCDNIKITAIEI